MYLDYLVGGMLIALVIWSLSRRKSEPEDDILTSEEYKVKGKFEV